VDVGPRSAVRVHYHRRVPGRPDGLTCEVIDRGFDEPTANGRRYDSPER